MYYTGREMKLCDKGIRISETDWRAIIHHLESTLDAFWVPPSERDEVMAFINSVKGDVGEV